MSQNVIIVGGGISGLAAAWYARQAGHRVTVVEASDRCGGVLAPVDLTWQGGSISVDAGAESVLNAVPWGTDLIRDVGLGDSIEHPRTAHSLLASHGALHEMPGKTVFGVPTAQTSLAGVLDEGEIADFETRSAKDFGPLPEDVSVAEVVGERCGQAVLDRLVEPLLGGVYAGHADKLSARAALSGVWAMLAEGGAVRDKVVTRAGTATKAAAPVFAGIRGGLWRLPQTIVERLQELGSKVLTGTAVTELSSNDDGWKVHLDDGRILVGDSVVVALQPSAAAALLEPHAPGASEALREVPAGSMAIVSAVLEGPLDLPGDLDSDQHSGMLIPPVEGRFVKAATFTSVKWQWAADLLQSSEDSPDAAGAALGARSENCLVRASVGREGDDVLTRLSDDEIAERALADLSELLESQQRPLATAVTRWYNALPQYNLGHNDRVARIEESIAAVPKLHYTSSVMRGVGIAACVNSAKNTVQSL